MSSEVEELREATRAAHEAIKDLRRLIREAGEAAEAVRRIIHESVHERIDQVVAEGLDSYKETLGKAIDDAESRVFQRFDLLADLMLGEDRKSRRQGKPSVPELVEQRFHDR